MATSDSLVDRLVPLFEHTHDAVTTGIVVVAAAVLGLYASWLTADFGVRTLAFAVTALSLGYLLYRQSTRRTVVAGACYSLAALVAATPVVYELHVLVRTERPLAHLLSVVDLLFVVAFLLVAAVPAFVGYRLTTGPFVPRLRRRL
ncbi:hypothetical protein [Halorarius halobius]|uniref:hypothetical protein n=1 Tax=Halorarius halobius TaxID=2962671 RepID=UPI0020CCBBF0|nr:hypothetical protein [Halorarius halobius]